MTPDRRPGEAPGDGTLVRYLDGEASPTEARAVEAALESDPHVRASLGRLERASRELRGLVDALPVPELPEPPEVVVAGAVPTPAGRRRVPLRRAAAVVLLLGGAAVAVSPLGAVLARQVTAWFTGTEPRAAVGDVGEGVAGGAEIGFPVAGEELVVEVERPQEVGFLVLEAAPGERATARAEAGSRTELVVGSRGLRVRNPSGARGDIRIGVPASVTSVRVRVGDGGWRFVSAAPDRLPVRIGLAGGG
ncbi:MAG: hypothetical protein PVI57_01240 [Gemmatimonadota bacterium]|jgi:hypothetical protein